MKGPIAPSKCYGLQMYATIKCVASRYWTRLFQLAKLGCPIWPGGPTLGVGCFALKGHNRRRMGSASFCVGVEHWRTPPKVQTVESGRRHSSPFECCPFPALNTEQGGVPLGDRRNVLRLRKTAVTGEIENGTSNAVTACAQLLEQATSEVQDANY